MINTTLNGKEYTLVDIYDYREIKVYHYKSDDNDLFYMPKEDKLHLIQDEKVIEDIKDEFDLNPVDVLYSAKNILLNTIFSSDSLEMSQDEKRKLLDMFFSKLELIKEHNIDFNKIKKALLNVSFFKGHMKNNYEGTGGLYHFATNSILISYNGENNLIFHELVHARGGIFCLTTPLGFVEGMTDSLTEYVFGTEKSHFVKDIQFNFSKAGTYSYQIAIIRQMEEAIGKKSFSSVLNADSSFFKEFGVKYGNDLTRYLGHKSSRLLHMERANSRDEEKYFLETQNKLLTIVFNKDFESVKTIEDMKDYFEKLDSFQLVRGRYKNDSFYKSFYEHKYNEAVNILKQQGLSQEEITNVLEDYKYNKKPFKRYKTEEEENSFILEDIPLLLNNVISTKEEVDFKKLGVFKYSDDNNIVSIVVYNGETISAGIGTFTKNNNFLKDDFGKYGIGVTNNNGKYILKYNDREFELEKMSINIEEVKTQFDNRIKYMERVNQNREYNKANSVNILLNSNIKDVKNANNLATLNNYLSDYSNRMSQKFKDAGIDLTIYFGISQAVLVSKDKDVLKYLYTNLGANYIKYNSSLSLIENLNSISKTIDIIYNDFSKEETVWLDDTINRAV